MRWFSRCGCGRSIGYQSSAAATAEFTRFKRIAEWTRREAWEKPPPKKLADFLCALKSGICSIKSGVCSTKSGICRYLQGLHSTCIYRKISCKCLQFYAKLLLFCVERTFACWGWFWLFFVSSKQCFCDHKPDFYVQKQKQCTLMNAVILSARRSRQAGYRTNDFLVIIDISRLLRLQTGGQGAIASGIRRQCRTAPTRMRRAMLGSIVKVAALYTNWLAPGFNIDSRERKYSSIKVQTAR